MQGSPLILAHCPLTYSILCVLSIIKSSCVSFSSVNVWRGLWSLQSHYFLPGLQQVLYAEEEIPQKVPPPTFFTRMRTIWCHTSWGWLLSPSSKCPTPLETITLWRFASICDFHFSHRNSFSGLWGGRGGANPVLEQGRDLRQEGGGPGGDGAHCGIGPSSSGPILSTWWPFWSWGCMNRSKWIESSIPGSVLTSYGYQSMLTVTQVEWFWKPPYTLQVKEWNDDWWACAVHSRVVFQVRIKYTLRWKPVLELLPPAWFLTPAGPFTGIFCDSLLEHYKNIEIEYSSGSFKQTFVTKGGGNFKEMSQVTKIVLNSGSQLSEL